VFEFLIHRQKLPALFGQSRNAGSFPVSYSIAAASRCVDPESMSSGILIPVFRAHSKSSAQSCAPRLGPFHDGCPKKPHPGLFGPARQKVQGNTYADTVLRAPANKEAVSGSRSEQDDNASGFAWVAREP
jgi:hypothetical protein